jgi:hypothetical protein
MNSDCFYLASSYLHASEAAKINIESVLRNFPTKIIIKSYEDAKKFFRWCQMFDTSNLKEVTYCIYDMRMGIPRSTPPGTLIGWVPPSVKVLRLDTYHCQCIVPNTIDALYVGRCDTGLVLPDTIKKLTLEQKFNGIIQKWPQNMESLTIHGYDCNEGPCPIYNLPEGLREMYVSWGVPIEVKNWPSTLSKLTIETSDDDAMAAWYNIEHAPIPENVDYHHKHFTSIYSFDDDDDDTI